MRIIEFRGKCKGSMVPTWCYGSLDLSSGQAAIWTEKSGVMPCLIEPETQGQFINKTDRNDTKMYEGDVVKSKAGEFMLIKYNERFASFCLTKPTGWIFDHFFGEAVEGKDVEVIGNIHDNTELQWLRT